MSAIEQEYTANAWTHDQRAHRRLWAAALKVGLDDAAHEFKQYSLQKDREHPRDMLSYPTLFWMYSDDSHAGSFQWMCDVLDMNHEFVRTKWRENVRQILRNNDERVERARLARETKAKKKAA